MAQDWRTLKLEVLAETGQFIKGMNDANAKTETFGDKLKDFGKKAALAFGAAAVAAGAYAAKLIGEGIRAAVEDEAAQSRLANALKNVTGATNEQIAAVEKQIGALSRSLGIADDELRPAFQRLATATGDLGKANESLALALDISAATGKSVEQVANALGKAYEGNTGALGRLGVGLSTAEIKALGLDGTMKQLSDTFAGAATERTKTFQGQMEVLKVRFDEAKETIGFAFLPVITNMLEIFNEKVTPAIESIASKFAGENGFLSKLQEIWTFVTDFFNPVWEAVQGAFEKVSKALMDNKEDFQSFVNFLETLWNFISKYILPIIRDHLILQIKGIATAFQFVLSVVSPIIGTISNLLSGLLNIIEKVISGLSKINPFGGGGTSKVSFNGNTQNLDRFGALTVSDTTSNSPNTALGSGVVINVNAPSAIDEVGFTRSVINALNSVERTTGGGASAFQYV